MQMILKIVSGPFGDLQTADISRLLQWLKPGDSLRVGRSGFKADMVISADQRMSSGHFSIACEENGCYLTDLGSTNGTFVNGQAIGEVTLLHDGDEIVAGSTKFTVDILDPNRSNSSLEIDRFAADTYEDRPPREESSHSNSSEPRFSLEIVSGPEPQAELHETSTVNSIWLHRNSTTTVGSSATEADFAISGDIEISPVHFHLELRDSLCLLKVFEDCNTVRVNNLGVRQGELSGGERITVGQTILLLRLIAQADAPPPQVPPKAVAQTAQPTEEDIARRTTALSSGNRPQIEEALQWFLVATPVDRFRDKACQKLATFVRSSDPALRRLAAQCYARWTLAQGQPTLLQMLESPDSTVVRSAIEGLLKLGTPESANAIAQLLLDPARSEVARKAIVTQAQNAEHLGIRLLLHDNQQVQLAACSILETVGTKHSELALQARLQRSTGEQHKALQTAVQKALDSVRAKHGSY